MTNRRWFALLILAALSPTYAAPLEAYARLPLYENVALSPDGTKVAFVTTVGDQREIVIQSLNATLDGRRLNVGDKQVRRLAWIGADHLVVSTSRSTDFLVGGQLELYQNNIVDIRKKALLQFSDFRLTSNVAILSLPHPSWPDAKGTVALNGRFYSSPAIFQVNPAAQTLTVLDTQVAERGETYQWLTSALGEPVALSVYKEKEKQWSVALLRDKAWVTIQSVDAPFDEPNFVGVGPEKDFITISRIEDGKWTPRRLSLLDGKWGEALPENFHGDSYILDRATDQLFGAIKLSATTRYTFFDERLQNNWDWIVSSFPEESLELIGWSDDWQKLIVKTFGAVNGCGYVLIDTVRREFSYLGDYYSQISAKDIALVKPISYQAEDAVTITGYLTVPRNKLAKQMPLIVMPHGGPASRDVLRFDWFAQALASRGYLVLQANFRGSRSKDAAFQQAGYGEMGRKMQTDLSDGVRALVKTGIVDPKRVCIVGQSYGGYAALAGVSMQADIYRCSVSIAGVSDIDKQYKRQTENYSFPDNRILRKDLSYVGAKKLGDPILDERSPAKHADKVNVPILLIHGDNDSVVAFEQSQIMANALKKAGKQFEFVRLKSEDHWLSKADTRLQTLQTVVKFLEANNPP